MRNTQAGAKAGTTEYRVVWGLYIQDDEGDIERMENDTWVRYRDEWYSKELPNIGLARAHARNVTKGKDAEAQIEEIEWVGDTFDDPRFGTVQDATAEVRRRQYAKFGTCRGDAHQSPYEAIVSWSEWGPA